MPKVSVILPVYNIKREYLVKAVESVLNQTFTDFELLIIDDGSKADTAALCDELASRDRRIMVFHNKNQGPGKSRNFGLDQAKGEFLIFMDHDDWVETVWLEKLYNSITKNNTDAAFCYANEYFENEDRYELIGYPHFDKEVIVPDDQIRHKLGNSFFPPWAKMVRADFVKKHGLRFAEDDNKFDDVLFHVFLNEYAQKISFVNDVLYYHRMFDNSITCTSFENTDMYFDVFKTMDDVVKKCKADGSCPKRILDRNIAFFCTGVDLVKSKKEYEKRIKKYIKELKLNNVLRKMKIKKIKNWIFTCNKKKKILRIFGICLINKQEQS